MAEAELTQEQRFVIEKIYELFYERGVWPSFAEIDRPLRHGRGIDAGKVIPTLPRALAYPTGAGTGIPAPVALIRLTLFGITLCPFGDIDAARIAWLLPWLARRESSQPSPPPATSFPR